MVHHDSWKLGASPFHCETKRFVRVGTGWKEGIYSGRIKLKVKWATQDLVVFCSQHMPSALLTNSHDRIEMNTSQLTLRTSRQVGNSLVFVKKAERYDLTLQYCKQLLVRACSRRQTERIRPYKMSISKTQTLFKDLKTNNYVQYNRDLTQHRRRQRKGTRQYLNEFAFSQTLWRLFQLA